MTDISDTLAPNSDQLDAVDLRGRAPQVFAVTRVDVRPSAEQPVSVHLAEFPRVWRPGKSMRRVLAFCWGSDSAHWTGRQEIGRAHVCTPVTNAQLVCRLLLEKKKTNNQD